MKVMPTKKYPIPKTDEVPQGEKLRVRIKYSYSKQQQYYTQIVANFSQKADKVFMAN